MSDGTNDTNASLDAARAPRIAMISLGCSKNLVDSEKMLADVAAAGCVLTSDPADAHVIVVNTCGFLAAARDEALGVLAELKALKAADPRKRIVVVGCLVERDKSALLNAVPYVDAILGVNARGQLARAVLEAAGRNGKHHGRTSQSRRPPPAVLPAFDPNAAWSDRGRLRLTPRHYAYLRICEGCRQRCTFCTIPAIRGPFRSKRPDEVLAEAAELVADGARELVLIGQDTTSYGRDIGYAAGLAGLLRELDARSGAHWLRLMYTYPGQFTPETIEAIAACDRVVKYVDVPLQHVSDRVLRRMGRRTGRRRIEDLLGRLRQAVPGIAIRTTFIVGFPGETEADFAELLAFVRDQRFDAMGAFVYSREDGTPAARLPDQIDQALKLERLDMVMRTQQQIALAAARSRAGASFEVLLDGPSNTAGWYNARHSQQAPEVDGIVRVRRRSNLRPGDLLKVLCTGSDGYDLLARAQ